MIIYSIALAVKASRTSRGKKVVFTGFVVIEDFVQRETGLKNLVDMICVLDIVANLVFEYACAVDKAVKISSMNAQRLWKYTPKKGE